MFFVGCYHKCLQLSHDFICSKCYCKFHCTAHKITTKLIEHFFKSICKRKSICNTASKSHYDLVIVNSTNFYCITFHYYALSHGNLSITCNCCFAILFYCYNCSTRSEERRV